MCGRSSQLEISPPTLKVTSKRWTGCCESQEFAFTIGSWLRQAAPKKSSVSCRRTPRSAPRINPSKTVSLARGMPKSTSNDRRYPAPAQTHAYIAGRRYPRVATPIRCAQNARNLNCAGRRPQSRARERGRDPGPVRRRREPTPSVESCANCRPVA